MVTLISDIWGVIQLILTIAIMVILLSSILFLEYLKKGKDKRIIYVLITFLFIFLGFLLLLAFIDLLLNGSQIEIILQVIVLFYTAILICMILMANFNKKYNRTVFLVILGIFVILMITCYVIIWIKGAAYNSLHIGSIFGVPALILVTTGTILVITNENWFVLYHGYTAGSAWFLTLLNVIFLFTLSADLMKTYSGWIHAFHIICGAVGLVFGFTSALFGISGQRKLAKVTGYTTLGCWWTAYLLSIFIQTM